jgi:hypothetical protein
MRKFLNKLLRISYINLYLSYVDDELGARPISKAQLKRYMSISFINRVFKIDYNYKTNTAYIYARPQTKE